MNVGDKVYVVMPSMMPGGLETIDGIVSEVLYDGSVNVDRDDGSMLPVAYGQRIRQRGDSGFGATLFQDGV